MQIERQTKIRGPLGALLLFLLLVMPVHYAQAERKTDVITLYNGDRITGEIKSLLDGKLSLSTDSMGSLSIEWQEIANVDSNYNYEVRLGNGERFFGTLHNDDKKPGIVGLIDVFGERTIGAQDVVEIRPVDGRLADQLEVYVSANYSFTKASGVAQTELNATASYDQRDATNSFSSRLTVSDTDEESTVSSRVTAQRRTWTDRKNVYRRVFGGFESNDELALDARYTLGYAFGRYFMDTSSSTFSGDIGAQVLTEQSTGGERQDSMEAVLTAEYSRWRFDTPKLDMRLGATLYPSLTESGRLRADTTAVVRWEIIEDLFWNVSTWGTYDNNSVDIEGGEFDWGITTGLGWTF